MLVDSNRDGVRFSSGFDDGNKAINFESLNGDKKEAPVLRRYLANFSIVAIQRAAIAMPKKTASTPADAAGFGAHHGAVSPPKLYATPSVLPRTN